jgi:hypothetical protein
MLRIICSLAFAVLLSCSILEESDITSSDDLKQLKLTSLEVTETLDGFSTTKAALVKDESVNEVVEGATISKRVTISWPTFTNPKLLFKSGATTEIQIIAEYFANGRVKFWRVKSGGTEVEKYIFRYDAIGAITSLQTYFNNALWYDDTFIQGDLNFPSVRNQNVPNNTTNRPKGVFGGTPLSVNNCGWGFVWQYDLDCSSGKCIWTNQKEYNYCSIENFYIVNKGGMAGGKISYNVFESDLIEEILIGESEGANACCLDKFFFHPFLFMKADNRVRIQYAVDWWQENNDNSNNKNRSVRVKFIYE